MKYDTQLFHFIRDLLRLCLGMCSNKRDKVRGIVNGIVFIILRVQRSLFVLGKYNTCLARILGVNSAKFTIIEMTVKTIMLVKVGVKVIFQMQYYYRAGLKSTIDFCTKIRLLFAGSVSSLIIFFHGRDKKPKKVSHGIYFHQYSDSSFQQESHLILDVFFLFLLLLQKHFPFHSQPSQNEKRAPMPSNHSAVNL